MDEENPDFLDCTRCDGEFYRGDLRDALCADCREAVFDAEKDDA